jgi:hypothetical protein
MYGVDEISSWKGIAEDLYISEKWLHKLLPRS